MHRRSPYAPREDRRDRTARVAARRLKLRVRTNRRQSPPEWVPAVIDRGADLGPHVFAKRGALACDCRHRRHSNPKVPRGICAFARYDVVAERRAGRRAARYWRRGGGEA